MTHALIRVVRKTYSGLLKKIGVNVQKSYCPKSGPLALKTSLNFINAGPLLIHKPG
jgi:hypothetical protein